MEYDADGTHHNIDMPASMVDTEHEMHDTLVEEIVSRIPQEVPEYSRPLEGEFGTAVRRGVEIALGRLFIDLPGRDEPLGSPGGAAKIGPLGVDTPLVASLPKQNLQGA